MDMMSPWSIRPVEVCAAMVVRRSHRTNRGHSGMNKNIHEFLLFAC